MSKLMRIGAKAGDGTAKAVTAGDNGVITEKYWNTEAIKVVDNAEPRNTGTIVGEKIDVSRFAVVSIRVESTLDSDIRVQFYSDVVGGSTVVKDASGSVLSLTIPANAQFACILPEDVPFLSYMKFCKLRVVAASAPTTGKVTVWVLGKR